MKWDVFTKMKVCWLRSSVMFLPINLNRSLWKKNRTSWTDVYQKIKNTPTHPHPHHTHTHTKKNPKKNMKALVDRTIFEGMFGWGAIWKGEKIEPYRVPSNMEESPCLELGLDVRKSTVIPDAFTLMWICHILSVDSLDSVSLVICSSKTTTFKWNQTK